MIGLPFDVWCNMMLQFIGLAVVFGTLLWLPFGIKNLIRNTRKDTSNYHSRVGREFLRKHGYYMHDGSGQILRRGTYPDNGIEFDEDSL